MPNETLEPLTVQVIAAFDATKAAIANVQKYTELTVEKHGITKVTAGRVAVKKLRVAIDHRRKELIEDALKTQREVNAYAKQLTAEIVPVEAYLTAQEDAYEQAKVEAERVKQAARQAKLNERIQQLAVAGAIVSDVAALELMSEEQFIEHLAVETVRVERERIEREAAALEAQKLEAERHAEMERQAEELRIRQEELETERKVMEAERQEMDRQQAEERKRLEEQQAEVARQHAEIAAAKQREADEERARVAELQRVAKLERLKPELEKAETFIKDLDAWAESYLEVAEVRWKDSALVSIERACIEIRKNVERLDDFA